MAGWNTFDKTIFAPGRDKADRLRLGVSEEFFCTHLAIRRLTPIYQLHAHVLGQLPPINLIESVNPPPELTTLDDALALFEGVKRPHDDEEDGSSVLIYVLQPETSIQWAASMTVMAESVVPPPNSTLTVLARTDLDLHDDEGPVHGMITRVEWVMTSLPDLSLPKSHSTRYDTRHW